LGLGLIWAVFLLHYSGVKNYGRFIVVLFFFVLFAAFSTILIGFSSTHASFLSAVAEHTGQTLHHAPTHGSAHFLSVVTLFVFSYGGLAAATSLGGEARDAKRSIGRGVWLAWGIALVLYTLVSFALLHVVPAWAVPQLASSGHESLATTPGLISIIAPRALGLVIDAVVVVIIAKTVAPEMLDCSRYLFAWSQDRLVPSALMHTNRHRVPDLALLVSAVLGSVFLVEATLFGFEIGVVIRSMSLVLVFGALGVGILNLRFNRRLADLPWARAISGRVDVVVAAVAGIVIAVALEKSVLVVPDQSFWVQPSVQAVIALVVAAGLYAVARRRSLRTGLPLAAGEPPAE
jgi:amino acid transporter